MDSDRPVKTAAEDKFNRAGLAELIARHLTRAAEGESLVFALTGPWGSGKTSILNLVAEHLSAQEKVTIVRFNPWLFSGTPQIVASFLQEVSAQLGTAASRTGKFGNLIKVGGAFLALTKFIPGAPPVVGDLGDAAAHYGETLREADALADRSVEATRAKIEQQLTELQSHIIIILDDIDRLESREIREMFKAVRLVADLPNIIYLLAFDQNRVATALTSDGLDGQEYLEKIVQCTFDVPPLDTLTLSRYLVEELNRKLEGLGHGPLHPPAWSDVLTRVLRPLIRTPRDVLRYTNAVPPTVEIIDEDVALEDVLALEAVRIFLPRTYSKLASVADLLTVGDSFSSAVRRHRLDEDDHKAIHGFIRSAGSHAPVVQELCGVLFPPSRFALDKASFSNGSLSHWRKERKVACREVLDVYMERATRDGSIRARTVRVIAETFADGQVVSEMLANLGSAELEAVILRLVDFTEQLVQSRPEEGLAAVLRAADKLRLEENLRMLDFGPSLAVRDLLRSTLMRMKSPARDSVVRYVFRETSSLSWRFLLLDSVASEGEQPLVSRTVLDELETTLREAVVAASPTELAGERNLLRFLWWTMTTDPDTCDSIREKLAGSSTVCLALLAHATTVTRSQTVGSSHVSTSYDMSWETIRTIAGSEHRVLEVLRQAVSAARDGLDPTSKAAVDLAREGLANGLPARPQTAEA